MLYKIKHNTCSILKIKCIRVDIATSKHNKNKLEDIQEKSIKMPSPKTFDNMSTNTLLKINTYKLSNIVFT